MRINRQDRQEPPRNAGLTAEDAEDAEEGELKYKEQTAITRLLSVSLAFLATLAVRV
jgi:hypothetical protein